MIRITDLKIPVDAETDPRAAAAHKLRIDPSQIGRFRVRRRSLDARKKGEISYVLTADLELRDPADEKILLRRRGRALKLSVPDETPYEFPYHNSMMPGASPGDLTRPIVVGMGPAGLFCAYELALAGFAPLVIERGAPVEERAAEVDRFWTAGRPDPDSNVCFGEGGAGAFSDGKLNTSSSDPLGRSTHVLETFVRYGADEEILSWYRPHVGTDALRPIIRRMREEILRHGGEIRFHTRLDGLVIDRGASPRVSAVRLTDIKNGRSETVPCGTLILAIGHSASDTYRMLAEASVPMRQKPFAVGFRVQHPQKLIDTAQYGDQASFLPPAEYRLRARCGGKTGMQERSVYSFCMCPGGFVVDSSSEADGLCINGMSYHDRAGENANSAIVVTVGPDDFRSPDPLGGLAYQKKMELAAFRRADGLIPVERYGDLYREVTGEAPARSGPLPLGEVDPAPMFKGRYRYASLAGILPEELEHVFVEGMESFGRKIPGFNAPGVLLAGVESRTSSPVRIDRDEHGMSAVKGLYPCGEGAGYAGGIMSAAVDGIIIAEHAAAGLISRHEIK